MKKFKPDKKIIICAIRGYYSDFNEISKPGTVMYPYISHQKNGNTEIEASGHNLFQLIINNYIPFQYKEYVQECDIKNTFKFLLKKEKLFQCVNSESGLDKYVPTKLFLNPKNFWTKENIAFMLSIISVMLWVSTVLIQLQQKKETSDVPIPVIVNVPETPIIINIPGTPLINDTIKR